MESRFCWTQCIGKPCLTQQSMIQLPRSCLDIHIITTLVWEKLLFYNSNIVCAAIGKDEPLEKEILQNQVPRPTKMDKLRYSGYSAEFLDRVEQNGNIMDKEISGTKFLFLSFFLLFC